MHDPEGGNVTFQQIGGDGSYGIPYRALIPQKIENLIVAGRIVSATHEALASVRSIAACEVMGQAAGTAAALCAAQEKAPEDLDIHVLQDRLVSQNAIIM